MRILLAILLAVVSDVHAASADDWAAGIPIGTAFPNINAVDQNNRRLSSTDLMGENGLAFFFNRSSDW